jgi:queuine tRNA-ribosyltransferase
MSILPFQVTATDVGSRARCGELLTAHGRIQTPAFMVVGTRATVTGLEPADLARVGTEVVLANTYHLMLRPGPELFRRVGGVHRFMGWSGPILTDSGGYQIFSLAKDCTVNEKGARFRSYVDEQKTLLSPERSIEMQTALGSDIMMALDVCIDSNSDEATTRSAMERTHRWAQRSLEARTNPDQALFAIVQGGVHASLRRESASALTSMPFDGFAIGGLAVGDTRAQREAMTGLTAELLPASRPRYLMGVGTPPDLLNAMLAGVDMFDCVIPTMLAQQGTGFTSTGRVRLKRMPNADDDGPLDASCDCATCKTFSRAYLHHLIKCDEPLGPRLIAMHNLHHYQQLMTDARRAISRGVFAEFAKAKLDAIDRHEHSDRRLGQAS